MVLVLLLLLLPRIIKLELRITLCIHASIPIKLDIRLPIHLVEPSAADPLLEEKLCAEEARGTSSPYVCVGPREGGGKSSTCWAKEEMNKVGKCREVG